MKRLIIFILLIVGSITFARGGSSGPGREDSFRDHEYNEMRDIVIPMMEQWERYKNMTPEERMEENRLRDENMAKYPEFHEELERATIGEESMR